MFVSTQFVPFAPQFHQLVAQGVLLLFVLVWVQLPVRFGIWLRVGVGRIGNEGIGLVGRGLGPAVHRRHDGGSLVAVNAKAALAWHLDQLRSGTGRRRQGQMAGAEGHTSHRSIDAGALVLAASTEILTVLINFTVVFTRAPVCLR